MSVSGHKLQELKPGLETLRVDGKAYELLMPRGEVVLCRSGAEPRWSCTTLVPEST